MHTLRGIPVRNRQLVWLEVPVHAPRVWYIFGEFIDLHSRCQHIYNNSITVPYRVQYAINFFLPTPLQVRKEEMIEAIKRFGLSEVLFANRADMLHNYVLYRSINNFYAHCN